MSATTAVAVNPQGDQVYLQTDSLGNLIVTAVGESGSSVIIGNGSDVTQGSKADSAATDSTSSWSVVSILKGLYAKFVGFATSSNQNSEITLLSEIENQLVASTTQVYTDGLSSDQIGVVKTFVWNSDGTLHSVNRNGRTKTFAYSGGNISTITTS